MHTSLCVTGGKHNIYRKISIFYFCTIRHFNSSNLKCSMHYTVSIAHVILEWLAIFVIAATVENKDINSILLGDNKKRRFYREKKMQDFSPFLAIATVTGLQCISSS